MRIGSVIIGLHFALLAKAFKKLLQNHLMMSSDPLRPKNLSIHFGDSWGQLPYLYRHKLLLGC